MNHLLLRKAIIGACLKMNRVGLNQGTAGNISVRIDSGLLITHTGLAYEDMRPSDLVEVGPSGDIASDQRSPSSEWRFHLALHQARPQRNSREP